MATTAEQASPWLKGRSFTSLREEFDSSGYLIFERVLAPERVEGSPRRKWAAMQTALTEVTEREVTVEMIRHDKEALEFDVTQCRFAQFFRALGEPELGALLVCATDFDIVAAGGNEVGLTRDQTLMQGAPSCTFRYRFAPRT